MSNLTKLNNIQYAQRLIDNIEKKTQLNHSVEILETRPSRGDKKGDKIVVNKKKRNALCDIEMNLVGVQKKSKLATGDATNDLKIDDGNFTNIFTNCQDIDELFNEGKGLKDNDIISIYGKAGLGKTQICHIYAANCLRNASNGKVIWISCNNNSFRPTRIKEILQSKGVANSDVSKLLDNILYADIQKSFQDGNTLDGVQNFITMAQRVSNVKLVIIDSIGNAYKIHRNSKKASTLYSTISPKVILTKVLNSIKEYVRETKVPVIMTNDVVANMSSNSNNSTDNTSSTNRFSVYSTSKFDSKPVVNVEKYCTAIYRLSRRAGGGSRRKMTLLSNTNQVINEAMFDIVTTGLA
jgi:RecA/RadA recombinase